MWHVAVDLLYGRIFFIPLLFLFGFLLERIAPAGEMRSNRDFLLNCVCGFFFISFDLMASLLVASLLVGQHGKISIFASDRGNLVLAFALAAAWLAVRDFFYYWLHRLQHASKWLWAEHMLHHSDEHLNITTSVRHHWLEMPLNALCVTAPMMLLFRPPLITVPIAFFLTSLVSYLIHLNVRLSFGRFSWVLAGPQTHRVHHSRLPGHCDKNFAQFFPLWDVIFRTYYHPQSDEYPASGLVSGETVSSLGRALNLPFSEWHRMISAKLSTPPAFRDPQEHPQTILANIGNPEPRP